MTEGYLISRLDFTRLSPSDDGRGWNNSCKECNGTVAFTAETGLQPQACLGCGELYYRALCVKGDHYVLVSDKELLRFANGEAIECPNSECEALLIPFGYPKPEVFYEALDIVTWKEDPRRKEFCERAHQRIKVGQVISPQVPRAQPPFFPIASVVNAPAQDDRARFDLYHSTTGTRLLQAEYYLLHIHKEYGRFSIEKSNLGTDLPDFVRHDLMLRGFIVNLRSPLDILCQEVSLYYGIPIEEHLVQFGRIPQSRNLSGSQFQGLSAIVADLIVNFREQWEYIYLNRLRNVLEHRRTPLSRTSHITFVDGLTSHEARPPEAMQLLADDPENPPGSETFGLNREICNTGARLLSAVNEFVLTIYGAAQ